MYDEFEGDAVAPLEGSVFVPKTPFLFNGVMHMPGQEGTSNRSSNSEDNGADIIKMSDEAVRFEIAKGLHEDTQRPISAVLNHCKVRKASPACHAELVELYSKVKKRMSARQKARLKTKRGTESRTEMQEEKFVEGTQKAAAKKTAKKKPRKKAKPRKVKPAKKYNSAAAGAQA